MGPWGRGGLLPGAHALSPCERLCRLRAKGKGAAPGAINLSQLLVPPPWIPPAFSPGKKRGELGMGGGLGRVQPGAHSSPGEGAARGAHLP